MLFTSSPRFFPLERPLYEVIPGLRPFGTDFGNGPIDKKIFQISGDFVSFRQNKVQCLNERFDKYIQSKDFSPAVEGKIALFLIQRFEAEYPEYLKIHRAQYIHLTFSHTQDRIVCDQDGLLVEYEGPDTFARKPQSTLEALLLQVPEDVAVTCRKKDRSHYLAYLNLCSPSHWAAEDKIGKPFAAVHQPIPGAEKLLKASEAMVDAMIHKGPFVRSVWSFVTDLRLNRHPEAPPGEDANLWRGRSFDKEKADPFYLRVERQTVWGMPSLDLSLFFIRILFYSGSEIKANPQWSERLRGALQSMTPQARIYKGVATCFEDLIAYLT